MMERAFRVLLDRYRLRRVRAAVSRFDLLLAVIPLAFVLAAAVAGTLGVRLESAMVGASVVGLLALVDGLFLRPPSGLHGA